MRILMLLIAVFWSLPLYAQNISLIWSANPSELDPTNNAIGYIAYRGEATRTYDVAVDVGAATQAIFPRGDTTKRYYFAVLAYDAQGDRSNLSAEVILDPISVPPPPCTGSIGGPSILGSGGGTVNVTITMSEPSCSWLFITQTPWITVTGINTNSGSGVSSFSYQANTGEARQGSVALYQGSVQQYFVLNMTQEKALPPPPPPPSDTTPPDIYNIRSSRSGNSSNYTLYVQSKAEDISEVWFYLNNRVSDVGHLTCCVGQNSFSTRTTISTRGTYTIRVVMMDTSGNRSEATGVLVRP